VPAERPHPTRGKSKRLIWTLIESLIGLGFSASKKSKSACISASKKLQRGKNLKKHLNRT
jgi:hypothetical protein